MNQPIIVFDLDDTLTRERDFVFSGFHAVGEYLDTHHQIHGFEALSKELFAAGLRGTVFDQTLLRLGHSAPALLVPELVEVYRAHKPSITLFEDASEILHRFKGRFPMAIITDGYLQTQRHKIEALGLHRLVDYVLCTDQLGREHWKPSPVPYQHVMDHFGRSGQQFTYIGDNPQKDFVTARQLGWRTIQIQRPHAEYAHRDVPAGYQADQILTDLRDVSAHEWPSSE